jgi:hypothetical protein
VDDHELTIAMWEDLIHLAAFQIIHGREAGYRRFRYLRFGTPETEPLPPGVDLDGPIQLPIWSARRG